MDQDDLKKAKTAPPELTREQLLELAHEGEVLRQEVERRIVQLRQDPSRDKLSRWG